MALLHYNANMMRKVMHSWHEMAGNNWKITTEKRIKVSFCLVK
jgi:hypothetical protein